MGQKLKFPSQSSLRELFRERQLTGNLCVFEGGAFFVWFEVVDLLPTLPTTFLSNLFGQNLPNVSAVASNSSPFKLVLAVLDTTVKFLYLFVWESNCFAVCSYSNIVSLIVS